MPGALVRSSAPLDLSTLAGATAPLGEATMLPAAAYVSPDVFAWEQRHLFAGTWSCVGREDDLRSAESDGSKVATQRAALVGDVGVLLTWSDRLRAFANTCRHRAHELLPVGGVTSRHSIVCPYHAWTYDLAGEVRATPGVQWAASGDAGSDGGSALGLVELPVRRWGGWVFVHAAHALGDPAVPAFDAHLGELAGIVAPYRTETLVQRARHTYEVAANWKVITENYHECYHCPLIHPELCRVSPPDSGDNYDLPGAWVGGSMTLRDGAETMSLTGRSEGQPLRGVDPRRVEYLGLFPDLLLSLHPDYVMTHRLTPLAPDRTRVECSWYFAAASDGSATPAPRAASDGSATPPPHAALDGSATPAPHAAPDGEARPAVDTSPIDPSYAVDFWDRTNRQDWAACESVQRGLSSPHFQPGPFAPNEDAVHRFVSMVARAYLGHPPVSD